MSTLPPAPAADATTTPLMRQHAAAKRQNPDALLFFRMGDFYELFFEDAQVASRELQITLTARDKERSVPMCGVPYHAADNYLSRLLRKGYRVAIHSWNNSLAEFADCLIDALNHRLGCRATATFDRKALKLAGFIEA